MAVSPQTIRKRLSEKRLLASRDTTRSRLTVRRTLEGRSRNVLHLHARSLSMAEKRGQTDQTGQIVPDAPEKQGPEIGQSDAATEKPTNKTDQLAGGLVGQIPDRPNGKPSAQGTCEEIGQFGRSVTDHGGSGEIKHKRPDCNSTSFWRHRYDSGLYCSECWPCTDASMMAGESKSPTRTER